MRAAVDIGGTKLLAAVEAASGSCEPVRVVRRATPAGGAVETLIAMLDEARDGAALEAIGMAVPGPFDRTAGRLVDPPNLGRSWWGLELRRGLGARFGCPVEVENDANCAALAEAAFGAGRGLRTVVYLTVSTGIGAGVVQDGRLLLGRHDPEPGHQVLWPAWLGGPPCHCGGAGCLEALASGLAIERRFGVRPEALDDQEAWDDIGRWLGLGVTNLAVHHDPDAIVLGGGVCESADRFWPALEATVETALRLIPRPLIRRAELGADRNLIGALTLLTPPA